MLTRLTVVIFLKYTEISNHYTTHQKLPQCSRSIILQKPTNKKTYRKRDFWFPEIRAGGIGQRQLKGANFQL